MPSTRSMIREAAAAAASSSSADTSLKTPPNLKVVGIILAVASGVLIGSSFVFKKKGLLRSQEGGVAGEGVAYLKSPLWWTGMTLMILGEICNFAAYAFVEAIVVTPLGALSVVICAILSSIFLKETLTFFGWLGCALCILGSTIIALNAPHEATIGEILVFQKLFLAPGFLVFISSLITASLAIIFYFAPKYGKKSMLWYIAVCSMIGGISVSVTTGLGAAIIRTIFVKDNQFVHGFIYFLIGFVVVTLLTEIYYLNIALALFNTAMVTPTYYVIFTMFTIISTIVLFQGLKASAAQIITIVMAFLVICVGITVLQMSKVDPASLSKLDRRSTLLLQAARKQTELVEEKSVAGVEDPGIDAVRGTFGTVGSIIRARSARRLSQSSSAGTVRSRASRTRPFEGEGLPAEGSDSFRDGMKRHQLYDAPVPGSPNASATEFVRRPTTLTFDTEDLVHSYTRPGQGDNNALHEHRLPKSPLSGASQLDNGYPPSSSRTAPLLPGPPEDGDRTPVQGGTVQRQQAITPTVSQLGGAQGERAVVAPGAARYARPDARQVFSPETRPSDVPLAIVPSRSDSTSSGGHTVSEEDLKGGGSRFVAKKGYPHGADDREESIRLWSRPSLDVSEESLGGAGGPSASGVRLVQPHPAKF